MSLAELETAIRLGCRICVLVYNDAAYSAEVHHFQARLRSGHRALPRDRLRPRGPRPRGDGATVRTLDDLAALQAWVESGAHGVFVVDVRIDPDIAADWFMQVVGGGNL